MKNDIFKRLIILDSLDEFDISDIVNEISIFLQTLRYDVKIVEVESNDICNFTDNEFTIFDFYIIGKVVSFDRYIKELEENENLIIIINGCFFNRFDKLKNFNDLMMKIENLKNESIKYIIESNTLLSKLREYINDKSINNFKNIIKHSKKYMFKPNNKKSLFKFLIKNKYYMNEEGREIIEIDYDMSSKGKFLKFLAKLKENEFFHFLMFKERIKKYMDVGFINSLSTKYNFEKHGEILSICRNLDYSLGRDKCISTIKMGHLSPLQFFHFTFKLKNIPRTVLIELERYRTINAMCCESTRYVLNKTKNPEDKIYKGTNEIVKKIAIESLEKIKNEIGNIPDDELKLALPEGFTTNLYMKMDARNIIHMFTERLSRGTHKDFRLLVYMMIIRLIDFNEEYIDILSFLV